MRHKVWTAGVLAIGLAAGAALSVRPAAADDAATLSDRVAALEKLVVRDPMHPEASVVDRLGRIEKSLSANGAADDLKTPEDFKKAIARLAHDQDDQDRRIKMLESDRRQAVSPDTDRAVRELRTVVQDNARSLRDVDQRLRRMENRF